MSVEDDMVWLENLAGERAIFRCNGKDPEEVAAMMSAQNGMPLRVVKQGDKKC